MEPMSLFFIPCAMNNGYVTVDSSMVIQSLMKTK